MFPWLGPGDELERGGPLGGPRVADSGGPRPG